MWCKRNNSFSVKQKIKRVLWIWYVACLSLKKSFKMIKSFSLYFVIIFTMLFSLWSRLFGVPFCGLGNFYDKVPRRPVAIRLLLLSLICNKNDSCYYRISPLWKTSASLTIFLAFNLFWGKFLQHRESSKFREILGVFGANRPLAIVFPQ